MNKKMKKKIAMMMIFVIMFSVGVVSSSTEEAEAATITNAQIQLSRIGLSENHSQILTFTIGDAFDAVNETMTITYGGTFDTNSIDSADIDFDDDGTPITLVDATPGPNELLVAVTPTTITFTQDDTTAASIATGSVITIKIGTNVATGADTQMTTPSSAGTYSIAISGDFGGTGTLYVPITAADDDQVTVSADVNGLLVFAIRNTAENADTNACALGTIITSGVSECSYRLKIGTNTTAGFQVGLWADDQLNQATASIDIDDIVENSTVTAGTEGHGITVAPPTDAGTNGTALNWTEQDPFNDDDTPIPVGEALMDVIFASDGTQNVDMGGTGDTTGTTLITHRAAISSVTEAGSYDQVVTYVVSSIL